MLEVIFFIFFQKVSILLKKLYCLLKKPTEGPVKERTLKLGVQVPTEIIPITV